VKVALVSTFPPTICGIASYSAYLSGAIQALDVDVTSVSVDMGVKPGSCPLNSVDVSGDYAEELSKAIALQRPDVAHFQHEYGIFGTDDRFLSLLDRLGSRGIRTVVTLHTVHTAQTRNSGCASQGIPIRKDEVDIEAYQRRVSSKCDRLIVHQDHPIRYALHQGRRSEDRTRVIPHGTLLRKRGSSEEAKTKLGLSQEPLIVAFGYFNPSKNPTRLLQAFSQLKKDGSTAKLWLSGFLRERTAENLECWSACQNLIRENQLESDVTFHQEVLSEGELLNLLMAADVVSMVYDEDTYSSSGAFHLAVGAGCAIVASKISKFQELESVAPDLLVDPRSTDAWTAVLAKLLNNGEYRNSACLRLDEFARQTSWENVANQHVSVYDEAIGASAVQAAAS
jgi:glycosyltransferase involved in cell wall biosynthesis